MSPIDRVSAGVFLFAGLSPFGNASAACIDVVDVRTELPHEVVTPNQTRLYWFYNLEKETYLVLVSRDGQRGTPYGPFVLTRGCAPATLRWESDEFVLLEAGCGTFCWNVVALPLSSNVPGPHDILRPLAFDADRNLVMFYAEKDTIGIRSLITGHEQTVRTARECESWSGICFDARFDRDKLVYEWRDDPTEIVSVPLDEALRDR